MSKERLYVIRHRLRDGNNRCWELWPRHLKLDVAQIVADQLWEKGYETMISAIGTEWDSTT